MLEDLSVPSPFVNVFVKQIDLKMTMMKLWSYDADDDNYKFLLSDAELSLAEVGAQHLGITTGRKFIKLLVKIWFIKIGLWLVKIENMICENMKTLQSTLVQKGEGGDVDWPFWVQQVNNLKFHLIISEQILDI